MLPPWPNAFSNPASGSIFLYPARLKEPATQQNYLFKNPAGREGILLIPELYHAPAQTFRDVIANPDDRHDSVALFSHNPGITAFVNSLTSVRVDNMPTCGVLAVKSSRNWTEFPGAGKEFWFFDYPKSQ